MTRWQKENKDPCQKIETVNNDIKIAGVWAEEARERFIWWHLQAVAEEDDKKEIFER